MNKEKIIKEIDNEINRIQANTDLDSDSMYWTGHLMEHLNIIKLLVENYDEERANLLK